MARGKHSEATEQRGAAGYAATDAAPAAGAWLPLDRPRTVALGVGGRIYTYTLRRIMAADWQKYFAGIVNQVRHVDGDREQIFESATALLELVDGALVSCGISGAAEEVTCAADWKKRMPPTHRMAVGMALVSVGPSDTNAEEDIFRECTEVSLDACWSAAEDGKMQHYQGLVHRFRQPSIAQLKQWNYEVARVRVRGTTGDGISIYPSRQAIAMKLYDELVESVEGYSVNGEPLASVEAIKANMDGLHKAEAALQLFLGSAVSIL